jgi:hypothetical protein
MSFQMNRFGVEPCMRNANVQQGQNANGTSRQAALQRKAHLELVKAEQRDPPLVRLGVEPVDPRARTGPAPPLEFRLAVRLLAQDVEVLRLFVDVEIRVALDVRINNRDELQEVGRSDVTCVCRLGQVDRGSPCGPSRRAFPASFPAWGSFADPK